MFKPLIWVDGTLTLDTSLFRYMSWPRFKSFVETKKTYITRATSWQDSSEALLARISDQAGTALQGRFHFPIDQDCLYAQCWTKGPESTTMWQTHCSGDCGLLIETRVRDFFLMAQLPCGVISPVRYYPVTDDPITTFIDFVEEHAGHGLNRMMLTALLKTADYEFEEEVRLVSLMDRGIADNNGGMPARVEISLDPLVFIRSITINPGASDEHISEVIRYCAQAGFGINARKSSLSPKP